MECGILGLPGSGKTALFRSLVGPGAVVAPGGGKVNVGVARIPEPRLEVINRYVETRQLTPATLRLVDVPGIEVGHGAAKSAALLAHARTVEAIAHVVRCFEAPGLPGPRRGDPGPDMQALRDEFILADLAVAESAREKAARPARTGDAEARARCAVLDRVIQVLGEGRPASDLPDRTPAEDLLLRGYGLLSAKSTLYVANVAEDDLHGESEAARRVARFARETGGESIAIGAKLEAELAELDGPDRLEMLHGLGLEEPAIGPLARALNRLLGLVVFFTAGPKEIRAWTAPASATAPEAAGVVHSDMQRGFIRAECFGLEDLEKYHSEKAIRAAGKLRVEGKTYRIRDGDVLHFLFNV